MFSHNIQATDVENQIKLQLVCKWENSRFEQAKRTLHQDENQLMEMIEHYRKKKDREQIAMSEIKSAQYQ